MIYDKYPQWDIDVEKGTVFSLVSGKILGNQDRGGYLRVSYRLNKNKTKSIFVHILIWECVNGKVPEGYDVHHIDGNRQNNSIHNLELIEHSEHMRIHNINTKNCVGRIISDKTKEKIRNNNNLYKLVGQYTLDGELINIFKGTREVQRKFGYKQTSISMCCRGIYKQSYGFIWKYINEKEVEN